MAFDILSKIMKITAWAIAAAMAIFVGYLFLSFASVAVEITA